MRRPLSIVAALLLYCCAVSLQAQSAPQRSLDGLWEAKLRFGPDVTGTVILRPREDGWTAEVGGVSVAVRATGPVVEFRLPAGRGVFLGNFSNDHRTIKAHWRQAASPDGGSYLSPVTLVQTVNGDFRGDLAPLETALTFYLYVRTREDGRIGAFLRNPERNLGWLQLRADYLEREGDAIKVFAANTPTAKGRLLLSGSYDAQNDLIYLPIPGRGGMYTFSRLGPDEASDFYPRGRPGLKYSYAAPPAFADGWHVASVDDVGLSRKAVEDLIQTFIDIPQDSVEAAQIHAILIARHGKLVLEEYFHGENREKPHDTRSASKSIAADTAGAAIHSGVKLSPSTPVYQVMNGGAFPADLDGRKRRILFEHLMTMSSGLDCDESNAGSPGVEDNFWDNQESEPNFYKKALDLPIVREPGAERAYCSASANLTGGVVAAAAKRPFRDVFRDLVADPLRIRRYYFNAMPNSDAYLGGGTKMLPRDFMKFAQVHLSGGVWNGRRIYSEEWANVSTSALNEKPFSNQDYGYLWWSQTWDFKGKPVRVFYASGNGGNLLFGIPDLDMVVLVHAANYGHRVGAEIQNTYVPKYIFPLIAKR
jgi:CubicO group peptidase (beta-lactamase class C family)